MISYERMQPTSLGAVPQLILGSEDEHLRRISAVAVDTLMLKARMQQSLAPTSSLLACVGPAPGAAPPAPPPGLLAPRELLSSVGGVMAAPPTTHHHATSVTSASTGPPSVLAPVQLASNGAPAVPAPAPWAWAPQPPLALFPADMPAVLDDTANSAAPSSLKGGKRKRHFEAIVQDCLARAQARETSLTMDLKLPPPTSESGLTLKLSPSKTLLSASDDGGTLTIRQAPTATTKKLTLVPPSALSERVLGGIAPDVAPLVAPFSPPVLAPMNPESCSNRPPARATAASASQSRQPPLADANDANGDGVAARRGAPSAQAAASFAAGKPKLPRARAPAPRGRGGRGGRAAGAGAPSAALCTSALSTLAEAAAALSDRASAAGA